MRISRFKAGGYARRGIHSGKLWRKIPLRFSAKAFPGGANGELLMHDGAEHRIDACEN